MKCSLCSSKTNLIYTEKDRTYFQCSTCNLISLNTNKYLPANEEHKRYLDHNNDVNDVRYQNFVNPIVSSVFKDFNKSHTGLDFGCGPGPVISKLLKDKNYNIVPFDPFFANDKTTLTKKYNYIVCCEVVEHFYNPLKEFELLKSLLKENGKLYIMTSVFNESIDFSKWYYKNDNTHVVFYHQNTFKWIQKKLGFAKVSVDNNLITFQV